MRDKTHNEQIERWARFFKENPKIARKQLNLFIDAQIIKSREFYQRLLDKGQRDKIVRIRKKG